MGRPTAPLLVSLLLPFFGPLLRAAQRGAVAADFAQQQKAAPTDKPPSPAQRLKLQTDAVLDGLIFKLEPKS